VKFDYNVCGVALVTKLKEVNDFFWTRRRRWREKRRGDGKNEEEAKSWLSFEAHTIEEKK
jgi:hypothetical protein